MGSLILTKRARIIVSKVTSSFTTMTLVLMTAAPAILAFPAPAAAADGTLTVLINGQPPTGFCIAGPITVSGTGTTGQQGGNWHLAIGWGDGSATSTELSGISVSPTGNHVGLDGSGNTFTYTSTHTPTGTSTGIRVVLYHSQPSGQDGQVIVVNQCVAPPTQGIVVLAKHVINDNGRTAVASNFTLTINGTSTTGSTVHDSATVTGTANTDPVPTGNVTFTFWSGGSNCDSGQSVAAGTVALNGSGVADPSSAEGPLAAGSYAFRAHYAGDTNYPNGATSDCEPLTVTKASPTLGTTPNPSSGTVGAVLNDSATLTGAHNPTGSIVFSLFAPGDTSCSGAPAYTQTVALSGASAATSPGFTSNAAGTWHWTADYAGDANNNAAHSGCQSEPVTITQPAGQYCSPGYWKQSQHFDSWVGYTTGQTFSSVFNRSINVLWSAKGKPGTISNPTLLQSLEANGGGLSMLARVAVDALLNASALNSGFTTSQVIAIVQHAIDTGDYSGLSQLTTTENCPLN
jgi:uncharacterized protein (DUF2141 family)